jgi:hypothetical protein
MTPVEQSRLPWLLTCTDDAMEAARTVLTHLDTGRRADTAHDLQRISYNQCRADNEHGISIEVVSKLDESELVSFTTVVSEDLLPKREIMRNVEMLGFVHDLLETLLRSPRIAPVPDEFDARDQDRMRLAVARMAFRAEPPQKTPQVIADHMAATPLGTGGLHLVSERGSVASTTTSEWCVPGPVELGMVRTMATDDAKGRIVMRMTAKGSLHMMRLPDVMETMRLEADARRDGR